MEVTNNQTTINLEMGNVGTSIAYHDMVFDAVGPDFTPLEELEEPQIRKLKFFMICLVLLIGSCGLDVKVIRCYRMLLE